MWQSQRALPHSVSMRQREIRLGNRAVGLANSLRGMGQGAQPPLWDRLGELDMPVLLMAGGLDRKFRDVALRMRDMIRDAVLVTIPDAGHAVNLERPTEYARHVERFLAHTTWPEVRAGKEQET